jgi:hypothetical protein
LAPLNETIIRFLRDALGLGTQLVKASDLEVYTWGATDVNLTICQRLGADAYLSGKHGRDYLDETRFLEQGIEVRYQDFNHPVYPQLWGDFLPQMSSIDLLFNCGESSLKAIELANT